MKIRMHSEGNRCCIVLPTRLLFSKGLLKLGLRIGKRYTDAVPDIPPAALDALCDELRRIKKKHGSWELVHMESADGSQLQITL